jgi:hypothetical protein
VHALLVKWRHVDHAELKEPGSYFHLLAEAERITRTGKNPNAVPIEEVTALISERLGR